MTDQSVLVLSINRQRRAYVAEALRVNGAVIVEAITLEQAEGILRQLRFDALAIDFVGLGVGVLRFLDDLRVDHPETRVIVVGPPVDMHVLARLKADMPADPPGDAGGIRRLNKAGSEFSMSPSDDAERLSCGHTGPKANVPSNGKHNSTNGAGRKLGRRASN